MACRSGDRLHSVESNHETLVAARAATRTGDWETAAALWENLFHRGGSTRGEACAETVRALCSLGKTDEALYFVNGGLEEDPLDVDLLEQKGNVLVRRGFRRAAESCYESALAAEPDRVSLLIALGRVRVDLGLGAGAREPLQHCVKLGHRDAETYWLLGEAARCCGDWNLALSNYELAFAKTTPEPEQLVAAASVCLEDGIDSSSRELCISWLSRAIEVDPQYTLAHHQMAVLLAQQGRMEASLEHYRRAIEIDPTYQAAVVALAKLLAENRDVEGTTAMVERALALETDPKRQEQLRALVQHAGRPD
jgi:tetratricopeptide (TPR) repeat protein